MTLWLRLYTEALHDPKVQRLSDRTFKGWVNLLMLAKEHNGVLPELRDCAFVLRLSDKQAQALLTELIAAGLFEQTEIGLAPHNWERRQYDSDNTAERVRRFRERLRDVQETSPPRLEVVTCNDLGNVTRNVSQNVLETETDPEQRQSRADPEQRQTALAAAKPVASPETARLMQVIKALPGWPKTLALSTLQSKTETWQTAYPGVDISDEVRCMDSWLLSHPQRKASVGFVENWLRKAASDARERSSGGANGYSGGGRAGGEVRTNGGVARSSGADAADNGAAWLRSIAVARGDG